MPDHIPKSIQTGKMNTSFSVFERTGTLPALLLDNTKHFLNLNFEIF
jgi:hypothetical protein